MRRRKTYHQTPVKLPHERPFLGGVGVVVGGELAGLFVVEMLLLLGVRGASNRRVLHCHDLGARAGINIMMPGTVGLLAGC